MQQPTKASADLTPPAQVEQALRAAAAQGATRPAAADGVPTTRAELDAMLAKRSELSNQLEQLTDRRRELTDQRQRMSAEGGRGLDTRIGVIDERSARIESEILQADEAIASAMARGVTVGGGGGGGGGSRASTMIVDDRVIRAIRNEIGDAIGQSVAATVFGLFVTFLIWKGLRRLFRKKKPVEVPVVRDDTDRLAHLQQSMDVIAIEVERISEAQRFMSRLLNAGEAQPVAARSRTPEKARTDDSR